MDLSMLLNPFVLTSISLDLDNVTTYFGIKKFGTQNEENLWLRTLIERNGNFYGNVIHNLRNQFSILGKGLILYFADYLLHIHNEPLNFHKAYLYYWGGRASFATVSNYYTIVTEKVSLKNRLDDFISTHLS